MRRICAVALLILIISSVNGLSVAQDKGPELSKDPLSLDQRTVYRSLLEYLTKGAKAGKTVYLADRTIPLDQNAFEFDTQCTRGMRLEEDEGPAKYVHVVNEELLVGLKIVLVDPENAAKTVEENDPENVVRNVGQYPPDEFKNRLEKSVEKAFQNGYWTISEVVFDQRHNRAVVSLGFHCGRLCGFGNTIVLKKNGKTWKIKKECGGWIS